MYKYFRHGDMVKTLYFCKTMAKASKEKPKSKRPAKYEEKLKTNGSFMQLIGAVVKDAKSKDKKKP